MKTCLIVASLGLAFGTMGCATDSSVKTKEGAVLGAAAGAVVGGVIGHQSGRGLEGAAIGAGVGAVGGGVLGSAQDEKGSERR